MAVFGDYARYYNLLYREKDYAGETDFILSCLKRAGCTPSTLLDLGCGTGRHALEMSLRGITATGIDMSRTMLEMGREAFVNQTFPQGTPSPQLYQGDARSFRLGSRFDSVTSLFHVMSYQNTEDDAVAVLRTAWEHLAPGGVFLFDFWYGPGVLTEPPARREKKMEDEHTCVVRKAEPIQRTNDNIVEVHYSISITDKASGTESQLNECHSMRYWFLPELRYLAKNSGFKILFEGTWMTDNPPEINTWNAYVTAIRI